MRAATGTHQPRRSRNVRPCACPNLEQACKPNCSCDPYMLSQRRCGSTITSAALARCLATAFPPSCPARGWSTSTLGARLWRPPCSCRQTTRMCRCVPGGRGAAIRARAAVLLFASAWVQECGVRLHLPADRPDVLDNRCRWGVSHHCTCPGAATAGVPPVRGLTPAGRALPLWSSADGVAAGLPLVPGGCGCH